MSPRGPLAHPVQAAEISGPEAGAMPCIPVSLAFRPASAEPPSGVSLLVMVHYEELEYRAYCDVCDYSDGRFLGIDGDPIPGTVLAWAPAPEWAHDQIAAARRLS